MICIGSGMFYFIQIKIFFILMICNYYIGNQGLYDGILVDTPDGYNMLLIRVLNDRHTYVTAAF